MEISDSTNLDDNGEYIISSHTLGIDGSLGTVTVFDGPKSSLSTGTIGRVKRTGYSGYNQNGLNCAVRPRALYSNTPSVQVALPNSATIISSGAKFQNLELGLYETIAVEVDASDVYQIPVYNSAYSRQTIDTAVSTINRYCVSNNLNIFAYKIKAINCYELAIAHNVPNHIGDIKSRTLKLVSASSMDAADAIGLSYIIDQKISGLSGNSVHINGKIIDNFGQPKRYVGSSASIVVRENKISSSTIDFASDGIRIGDLCVIDGSTVASDDGTYSITYIDSDLIELDYTGNKFLGELDDDSSITFLRSTVPISELNFLDINGSMIIDIFADETLNIFHKRRADIIGSISLSNFYLTVSDLSRGFITNDQEFTLTVSNSGYAKLNMEPGGAYGDEIFVGTSGEHRVFTSDKMEFVTINVFVPNESSVIFPSGQVSISIVGKSELPTSVLHLSRCVFSPEFGTVIDDISSGFGEIGATEVIDKRVSGTIDDTIISEAFIERYIQGPRGDLRANGVIRNLAVSSFSTSAGGIAEIYIDPGVCIVSGMRTEYLGGAGLKYKYSNGSSDNFYIGIDSHGCIVISNEVDKTGGTDYLSPFSNESTLLLAYIDISSSKIIDLRLMVDKVDYKLLGNVTVSPLDHFGHFKTIQEAVNYCRIFTKFFPDYGTPSIKLSPGEHLVSAKVDIDFDLDINGCGPSSIVSRANIFDAPLYSDLNKLFEIGKIDSASDILYGVNFSNFTYRAKEGCTGIGFLFSFVHNTNISGNSDKARFSISNIRFIGPSDRNLLSGPTEIISVGDRLSDGKISNLTVSDCHFYNFGWHPGPSSGGAVWCFGDPGSFTNILVSGNTRELYIIPIQTNFIWVTNLSSVISGVMEVSNVAG